MPNTNFQTIFQMPSIVNDIVKQATGRNSVSQIDMDFITVAQDKQTVPHEIDYTALASFVNNNQLPLSVLAKITAVQSGEGDPAPDNVRPIRGYTGVKVIRTGKNFITPVYSMSNPRIYGVTVSKGDNEVTLTQTTEGTYTCYGVFYYLKSGKYTLKYKAAASDEYIPYLTLYKGATTLGSAVPDTAQTFTITEDGIYEFRMFASRTDTGSVGRTVRYYNIMFEQGETATAYEPYNGNVYNIAIPQETGTVYGGVLDVNTGVLTVDKVAVVIDSSVTFFASTAYPGSFYKNRNAFTVPIPAPADVSIICSHAKRVTTLSQETYTIGCMYIDGSVNLRLLGTDATLEDWNTYVDAQKTNGTPVTIMYNIATPITVQLTPTEIKSLVGENNLYADTGDVAVSYTSYIPVP